MLSAYIIKLVFWLRQVYYQLIFHCGGSEAYNTSRSIENTLNAIHAEEYISHFTALEWCITNRFTIDVSKW